MVNPWMKKYELLEEIVEGHGVFLKRLVSTRTPSELAIIRVDLQEYVEVKNSLISSEREIESQIKPDKIIKDPFQRKYDLVSSLESKFDSHLKTIEKTIAKNFKLVYKQKLKVKDIAVLEKKKADLFGVCLEYESLKSVGFFSSSESIHNRKVERFSSFYRQVQVLDGKLSSLTDSYQSASSKDELKVFLNQAKSMRKDYKLAASRYAPLIRTRSNPYSCKLNILNLNELISKISMAVDSFDGFITRLSGIQNDIRQLERGELAGLSAFKYSAEKKNSYLKGAAIQYENAFKETSEQKEKKYQEFEQRRKEQARFVDRDAVFNLPVYIESMGLPRNPDYYQLRHILLGMWDKDWMSRFSRLESELGKLEPARDQNDLDYIKRLDYLIEKSTTQGMILNEIECKKANAEIVNNTLLAINRYIFSSEAVLQHELQHS